MVYGEPTIADQVKEVTHDTGEAIVETANDAVESVKEMVTPEPTFTEKIQNAAHSAAETVQGWWARVEEWWNPPWITIAAIFVCICWFAYKWYKNRQNMNNEEKSRLEAQRQLILARAQRQLIFASCWEDLAVVRVLVSQGVNPNAQIPGYWVGVTPLMAAAEEGREDVTQFLLSLPNIKPDARDDDGWTALSLASLKRHLNIVKLLLEHGADPEAVQPDSGTTLLMAAAREGWEDVAQFLLSLPDINMEARCRKGRTAMVFAAVNGHRNLVRLLLDHGAEPAVLVNSGRTVLDLVAGDVIECGSRGYWEERDNTMEVLRYLVLEVGLPVTDKVRRAVAGDAEALAICELGRAEARSLKKLARRAVWELPREAREELPVTVQEFVNY